MKIGIVCHPTMGGSGYLASQLALELANRGYEVCAITYETPVLLRDDRSGNLHVQLVDIPPYPLFRFPPYTTSLTCELVRTVRKMNLDLIHVHYAIPHALAAYLTHQIEKTPYVVSLHGSDVHLLGIDPAFKCGTAFAVNHADSVTAVSQFLIDVASSNMGIHKEIIKIPNFVDCSIYKKNQNTPPYFRQNDELNVTHISNFRPVKRVLDIVQAFPQVVKQVPNARLLLVGDGPERTQASRLANTLGISKNVSILGIRVDIPSVLNETDVFVLPSQVEGCPLSILEAMSSSIPVVATHVGGIPEFVTNNKDGFLVPPKSPKLLAEKIVTLLLDERLRKEMGENGRTRVCQEWAPDKIVPQYEAVYHSLMEKN